MRWDASTPGLLTNPDLAEVQDDLTANGFLQ